MMKYYLDRILDELINDERLSKIEGIARECNRKVYIEGGEYQEYSTNLIFLVDTGECFKKTIAFSIITNSFSCHIKVVKHGSGEIQTFNRKPNKNVAEYIINQVIIFQNKDKNYFNIINM